MATRYLVGGIMNSTASWSTSSGGAGGASIPTAVDDAIVDGNSPSCTVGTARSFLTLDFTGYTNTITMDADITVAGNVTLAVGMTIVDGVGILILNATLTVTSNGKAWTGKLRQVNAASRVFTITGDLSVTTLSVTVNANSTTNGDKIRVQGDYTTGLTTGASDGTSEIVFEGTGTITTSFTAGSLRNNVTFAAGSNYAVVGTWGYGTGLLKREAGATLNVSAATLDIRASCSIDMHGASGFSWPTMTIATASTVTLVSKLGCSTTYNLGGTTAAAVINGEEIVFSGTTITSTLTTGSVTGTSPLRVTSTCSIGAASLTTGRITIPTIIDAPGKTITITPAWQVDVAKWSILSGTVVNAAGQPWVLTSLVVQRSGRVIDTVLTPSSNPRLYFRAYSDGIPLTTLNAAGITTAEYRRRIGNVFGSAIAVGALTDGTEFQAYSVGRVIRHSCPVGNLYSIDAPVAATDEGAESVRLSLTFASGSVSADVIEHHLASPAGDTTGVTELLTRIPDATPGAEGGLPVLSAALTVAAELDSAATTLQLDAIEDAVNANTGYLTTLLDRVTVSLFSGITSLGDWIRRYVRNDVGTAGMAVAEAEIQTGGTATFVGTVDSLEAIKDAGNGTTIVTLQSVAGISPGVIVGPSEPLVIGDDYLTSLNRSVRVNLLDANGDPATVVFGDKSLADVGVSIQLLLHKSGKPSTTATIVGTCTFNAAVGDVPPYLIVEFTKTETAMATPGAYDMQAEAKWPAPGNETVTFAPYGQIQFTRNIARRS